MASTKATAKKTPAKKAAPKPEAAKAPPKKVSLPEKYTLTTMSAYLAESRGISRKEARDILDVVFGLLESGVLQGSRVPVGNLGKVHAKEKPATSARMGRNPLTGESIKIPAKKATKVPRFTFSKAFKEAVLKAKI
jgi:nucleoid DNA-binding protein